MRAYGSRKSHHETGRTNTPHAKCNVGSLNQGSKAKRYHAHTRAARKRARRWKQESDVG